MSATHEFEDWLDEQDREMVALKYENAQLKAQIGYMQGEINDLAKQLLDKET